MREASRLRPTFTPDHDPPTNVDRSNDITVLHLSRSIDAKILLETAKYEKNLLIHDLLGVSQQAVGER